MKWYYLDNEDAIHYAGDFDNFVDARREVSRRTRSHVSQMVPEGTIRLWYLQTFMLVGQNKSSITLEALRSFLEPVKAALSEVMLVLEGDELLTDRLAGQLAAKLEDAQQRLANLKEPT